METGAGNDFWTEWVHQPSPALVAVGEVDASSAPALSLALDRALRTGPRPVTLDLSRVTFMDAAALGVIAKAAASYPGQSLAVSGANPFTTRLFHIVGMERLLAA